MEKQNFIPILFSTSMVKAILEGRKLMTRRTKGLDFVNKNSNLFRYDSCDDTYGDYDSREPDATLHWFENIDENGKELEKYVSVKCPYGKVGDVLWVRETFLPTIINGKKDGNWYKASVDITSQLIIKWKSSLFMPKAACRIFLEITDVRVERLQDISNEDAIDEGIERLNVASSMMCYKSYVVKGGGTGVYPYVSFQTLWQSINGKESWEKNSWVWVVSFKRIEKPTDFC